MDETYQEFVHCQWDLILRTRDSDNIACFLGAWESDFAVELFLEFIDLVKMSNKLAMVETVDVDVFRHKLSISLLDHIHNLLLDQIQVLSVTGRSTADDIVDLDVLFLLAETTAVHGIRELDKDRIFLHDTLDMLTTNADNALMVLIGDVERDGRGHLLFDEIKSIFRGFILGTADDNVKVVLVEPIKDNLNAAVAHNLVNLAILLAADEFLVLVGQFDLDAHVVLRLLDEGNVADDHESSPDRIV